MRVNSKLGTSLRKCLVLALSMSLFFACNLASSIADEPDTEYVDCFSGGYITIQDSVVVSNELCSGGVEIPRYVTEIGNSAFLSSVSVATVIFESNSALETIGDGAFQSSGLTEITIPSTVTSIGIDAFADMSTLLSVSFDGNSTLETISEGTFRATGLREITVPASVKSIETKAFSETADLGFISFAPDSALETIGQEAFQFSGLTEITIPSSVLTIGSRAFGDTANLVSVSFLGNAPSVGEEVFAGISQDIYATILPDATGFEPSAWTAIQVRYAGTISCTSGYVMVVEQAIRNDVSCVGDLEIPSYVVAISEGAFSGSSSINSIFFSEQANLTVVEPFAFANSSLISISLPSSTALIMEQAFANTKKLESISFDPDSRLDSIGDGAFKGSGIPQLEIPPSVTSIGADAFSGSGLFSINIPASITSIGNQAFYDAIALASVSFDPNSKLESIGDSAFEFSGLMDIILPASVTTIGSRAFASTADLAAVAFENGAKLTSIGDGAFQDASMLTSVTIPESVTSIGNESFQAASMLTSVTIPARVTSIGSQAFANTPDLIEVIFDTGQSDEGSALQSIGAGAFSNSGILEIAIPASVTSIGDQAFANTADLFLVSIGAESTLEMIGTEAFSASGLEEFTIPARVSSIGDNAFANLPFLKQFIVDPENADFESDSGVLFTAGKTKLIQYPLGYESDLESNMYSYSVPESVVEIGSYAFSGGFNAIAIEFTDDSALETIGFNAFNGSQISQINIPASVTAIGEQAFANTLNLESITFAPDSVLEKIENSVFENSAISEIDIPDSVTEIGDSSFNASGLTEISISASVTTIGEQAFANTENLESVTFAADSLIENIEKATFLRSAITSIVLPDGLVSIGPDAFNDASALTEVTIPSSVQSVGMDAFSSTTALERVYFLGDAPTLESDFDDSSTAVVYKRPTAQGFTSPTLGGLTVSNGVFSVTFNSQGGSEVASKTLLFGKSISAPANPTRLLHTFLGWSATATGTLVRFPYAPVPFGDKVLFAKWQSNRATLDLTKPKPSISGKAVSSKKGTNKLTVKPGTWVGVPKPVITYAWYSCTSQVKSMTQTIPRTCKAIPKATKNVLPVISTYKGKFLAVKVTGTSRGTSPTFYLTPSTKKVT